MAGKKPAAPNPRRTAVPNPHNLRRTAAHNARSTTMVALLRGINVGTAKRVAMAELLALMEGLGYREVRTLLNSGNVVFTAPKTEPREAGLRIENALEAKLGFSVRVMVISARELAEVVAANPWGNVAANPSRLLVGILADPADREKLDEIARKDWGDERIAFGATSPRPGTKSPVGSEAAGAGGVARAVYMLMPRGVIESKLNAAVSKALGDGVTARNWTTVLKLYEMARGA